MSEKAITSRDQLVFVDQAAEYELGEDTTETTRADDPQVIETFAPDRARRSGSLSHIRALSQWSTRPRWAVGGVAPVTYPAPRMATARYAGSPISLGPEAAQPFQRPTHTCRCWMGPSGREADA